MTVAELIRELQAMPQHLPVHILPEMCRIDDEEGFREVYFDEPAAAVATDVRFAGANVLILGN